LVSSELNTLPFAFVLALDDEGYFLMREDFLELARLLFCDVGGILDDFLSIPSSRIGIWMKYGTLEHV
jgi:hypothetical protein